MTEPFTAPEIKKYIKKEDYESPVDLFKALSFTLGKMLDDTYYEESIEKLGL